MIGTVLTLKQLEAFIWVVDLGSFRKAAQHLNTTQPNISARISGLEKMLGTVLMRRAAGAIHLTDKGQEILDVARCVVRQAETIVDIADRPDLIEDRLRLGVTELVACTWLHGYLRQIKQTYASLKVELTVDISRSLETELASNHLDLTIQTAPFKTQTSGAISLGQAPYIWVAHPPIADQLTGTVTLADLLPHSVLTHARHTQAYTELADHAALMSLPTSRIASSTSLAACVQMAADGMGVTLLPRALVQEHLGRGDLVQIDVDWTPTPLQFWARYHADTAPGYLTKVASLAIQAFQTE